MPLMRFVRIDDVDGFYTIGVAHRKVSMIQGTAINT